MRLQGIQRMHGLQLLVVKNGQWLREAAFMRMTAQVGAQCVTINHSAATSACGRGCQRLRAMEPLGGTGGCLQCLQCSGQHQLQGCGWLGLGGGQSVHCSGQSMSAGRMHAMGVGAHGVYTARSRQTLHHTPCGHLRRCGRRRVDTGRPVFEDLGYGFPWITWHSAAARMFGKAMGLPCQGCS